MAATYVKYNQFVEDLCQKVHDLLGTGGSTADDLKVALCSDAPAPTTDAVLADTTQVANANGYTTGGASIANAGTRTTTTVTVNGTNVTWTAAGGSIGPFQYIVLYNDGTAVLTNPLIAYWDYGSALTLLDGESLTVKFNGGASNGTVFTIA